MTVEQVRNKFSGRLDIDPSAIAYCDGNALSEDATVKVGDLIIFTRRAGEKGLPRIIDIPAIPTPNEDGKEELSFDSLRPDKRTSFPQCTAVEPKTKMPLTAQWALEIRGGDVVCRSGSMAARLPITDAIKLWTQKKRDSFTSGLALPNNVRFVKPTPEGFIAVMELQPCVHRVRWLSNSSAHKMGPNAKHRKVTLSFPYLTVIFQIRYCETANGSGEWSMGDDVRCHCSSKPIRGSHSKLFAPPLLNCARQMGEDYTNSWLCTHSMTSDERASIESSSHALAKISKGLITCLWGAAFNYSADGGETRPSWFNWYKAENYENITPVEQWVKNTKKNPDFILDEKWVGQTTVLDVVTSMERNSGIEDTQYDRELNEQMLVRRMVHETEVHPYAERK